jgi:pimeloyl-ACP methyl ester carboxylesterase
VAVLLVWWCRSSRAYARPVLEFDEFGDPHGMAVVLQPGTPATGRAGELLDRAAGSRGVRLVAVTRPGYGAALATPPGLASVADQVGLLADELGLDRFGVLGLSGGGPYALAQGVATPDRVTRVVVAAGVAPDEPVQEVAELVSEANQLAARFTGLDAESFVAQRPPTERFFHDHPEYVDAFIADLRRAVARPDGYVRDNLSWEGDWDVSLADLVAPVDLIYGDADQMVTIDHGQRLAAVIPHAKLHVLPGVGHGYATFGSADLAMELLVGGSGL